MKKKYFLILLMIAIPSFLSATLYEDGEDQTTKDWLIYDTSVPGATISNEYSSSRASHVITLQGTQQRNSFLLGGLYENRGWNNTQEFTLQWSMNYHEDFTLYVRVKTTEGYKYIFYTPAENSQGLLSQDRYIHHALGTQAMNGTWQTFTRDLVADLKAFDADNTLISVLGFMIRGSGQLDDIQLLNTTNNDTPLESGETEENPSDEKSANTEEEPNEISETIQTKLSAIQNLLSDAASHQNNEVDYIIAGDSTRAWAINEMIPYYTQQFSKINVRIINNALSGQTAQGWIGNSGSFTHQAAINQTVGDGANTILEYSFGINDSYRYPRDFIKQSIYAGLATYLNAKPKAKVFLVTPVVTGNTQGTTILKEIYEELSRELNLPLIDAQIATQGVHGNSLYYLDDIHPNRFGSRRILNYIVTELLPISLHTQVTLEEHPETTASDWISIDVINEGLSITLEKE